MRIVVPDYYKDFKCLAGDCKHSCCIGWEVDIDAPTLEYYKSVDGEFGQRLKDNISYNDETAYFAMDSFGRCPFLNKMGMCDIMINLGFDKVSQICDDHPRFRNFYSDRTEIGLGLSCEAVAMQILSKTDKTHLVCVEGDTELLWEDEEDFLDLRNDLFDILQDRNLSIDQRAEKFCAACEVENIDYTSSQMADIILSLERLDPTRDDWMAKLKKAENLQLPDNETVETATEQLLVYFVFRHLTESLDDGRFAGRARFVLFSTKLIRSLWAVVYGEKGQLALTDMAEICRMYSAEVEYSPDNMNVLFDKFEHEEYKSNYYSDL